MGCLQNWFIQQFINNFFISSRIQCVDIWAQACPLMASRWLPLLQTSHPYALMQNRQKREHSSLLSVQILSGPLLRLTSPSSISQSHIACLLLPQLLAKELE